MHTHSLPSLYMCDECVCTWGGKSRSMRITVCFLRLFNYNSILKERNRNNFVLAAQVALSDANVMRKVSNCMKEKLTLRSDVFPLCFTGWWNTKITTFKIKIPNDRVQCKAFLESTLPHTICWLSDFCLLCYIELAIPLCNLWNTNTDKQWENMHAILSRLFVARCSSCHKLQFH